MVKNFDLKQKKVPITVSISSGKVIRDFVFILDTGASHSIINTDSVKWLGYSKKDKFKTETLQGFGGNGVNVDFIKVKSVYSLGLKKANFVFGISKFRATTFFDGILGIDFFINHKLCIDFKKGTISLE